MRLSEAQIVQFNEDGYLLVRGGLEDADIEPVISEYETYIDKRAGELLAAGKISQLYADQPFDRRLASICSEDNEIYSELDIMHFRGRACFEFMRNENLLDLVEGLIGPEITCSPIQHTRPKLPLGLTPGGSDAHIVPWHQDAGVTWEEADPYFVLTVWLPLVASTVENGCLEIIPKTHGRGLWRHHSKKGDVLLLHKEIPHRSRGNHSDVIRWSMDLRYQETGTPTGRPFHPNFAVRSSGDPAALLTDYDEWCRLWIEGLEKSRTEGVRAHRWPVAE